MKTAEQGSHKRTDQPPEQAFRSLIRVAGLMQKIMHPYFSKFGISGSQWGMLRTLRRAEEEGASSLHLMELGDRLLVRPPSVTGLVDRLQRLGYVVRTSASSDLRCKEVRLTPAGRELVLRVLEGHSTQVATVMGGLNPADLRVLAELLEKVADHLNPSPGSGQKTDR